MKKTNAEIREMIQDHGFCYWQVARKIKVHENTFYRWLRKDLSEEEKKRIYKALNDLKLEREERLSQIG